ncbi:MAG: ferrochelatase [Armatimonadetes bacterium]|nr:ferrochelatase [Armatimonadota bacterium]
MIAVLLMAYGTPHNIDEVEMYYTHIRHGRRPSNEEIADLKERYGKIGGVSPLREITEGQARGLQETLDRQAPGQFRVYLGLKHIYPHVADVAQRIIDEGHEKVVALVLAPHESRRIIDEYLDYGRDVFERNPHVAVHVVRTWHMNPRYLAGLERRIRERLDELPKPGADDTLILFTAHSLPEKILTWNDPYPERLMETSRALAERLSLPHWRFCFQSAGTKTFPWLGPDILDALEAAQTDGYRQVLAVPIGFVADHLEVLFDLDLEAQAKAAALGIAFRRTASFNVDSEFLQALADEVTAAIARPPSKLLAVGH